VRWLLVKVIGASVVGRWPRWLVGQDFSSASIKPVKTQIYSVV